MSDWYNGDDFKDVLLRCFKQEISAHMARDEITEIVREAGMKAAAESGGGDCGYCKVPLVASEHQENWWDCPACKVFSRHIPEGTTMERVAGPSPLVTGFSLVAHYDMGRRGDLSSLNIAMPHLKFSDQLAVCRVILDMLPVAEFRIDPTGVGAAMADTLREGYGPERIKEVRS